MISRVASDPIPIVLIPGVNGSARLFAQQIPPLWRFGPVMVADHSRANSMAGIARQILSIAPPRFALAGVSMGGFIAFEMLRQASGRILRLALLHTSARPETAEQHEHRRWRIEQARAGHFAEVVDAQFPNLVHKSRRGEAGLLELYRAMAADGGPEAFVRQQTAILSLADSRPTLRLVNCPALIVVGDSDILTPRDHAEEMADGIANARLVVVSDCGHLSPIERPDVLTSAMLDWLQGQATPGAGVA